MGLELLLFMSIIEVRILGGERNGQVALIPHLNLALSDGQFVPVTMQTVTQ
jgi:hypothetical protein